MEEWIGLQWHRLVTRAADRGHAAQAVALGAVQQPVQLLFHAAGGAPGVRVVPAAAACIGGPRSWLQRLAGSGLRAPVSRLDGQTLALPPVIDVFDDPALNRDLYLWLAALAAVHQPASCWLQANAAATALALQRCPGLRPRWQRLLAAHLAQRPRPERLAGPAALAELRVQAALRGDADLASQPPLAPTDVAPVWLWLEALPEVAAEPADATQDPAATPANRSDEPQATPADATRRRTRRAQPKSGRAPLLLPSRAESVTTFGEHVPLDRGTDDSDDGQARTAADDMDALTLERGNGAPASRIKFDLDLPSASADDLPLGPALTLPEWDFKQQRLLPQHCRVVTLAAAAPSPWQPPPALQATARAMRRRLEVLRAAPHWQRGCTDGDAIDIDAWVRHAGSAAGPAAGEPPVFNRRVRGARSLATLLLADLSLSTDAYVNNDARVVDVVREALFVFGEALHGTGDAFAMLGFSSVRRQHVRLQHLKGFDEAWAAPARARVGAIKPGYYTRMGAAIRAATQQLQQRPERQRLLLILTDGKPNDLDRYEGRWGLEDTRHAVAEAREAGLLPFCISIDAEAHAYLPHLFGPRGWAWVQRPAELPARLAAVYARLTRG